MFCSTCLGPTDFAPICFLLLQISPLATLRSALQSFDGLLLVLLWFLLCLVLHCFVWFCRVSLASFCLATLHFVNFLGFVHSSSFCSMSSIPFLCATVWPILHSLKPLCFVLYDSLQFLFFGQFCSVSMRLALFR